jgi:putative MATE family efflux protein
MTDILKDKTYKALTAMSIPISMGMLSTFLFQIVDTYFVGKLGGNALAALSFSSTIFFVLVGLFIGLSVGVSIIVGQAVGAGDHLKVFKTLKISIVLSFLLSVLFSVLFIVFIDPIFTFMGANSEVLPLIRTYTIPVLIGMPLLNTGVIMGGILRASGNITKPEVVMGVAGIFNLFFDYGLIFGKFGLPELGLVGAAYATVFSWFFVLLGMLILLFKDQLINFKTIKEYSTKSILSEIQKLSSPTIVTQITGPLTLMYLTFLLAKQSSMAVAAFGVAGRIEMLLMIGVLAVSTAITPFVAQNEGAKQHSRIDESIVFGGKAATYMGLLLTLVLFLFIKPIAAIFSDNEEVILNTIDYFHIVSLSYIFYGLYVVTTAILNGLQLTVKSLKISLIKSFTFTVPFTMFGSVWGAKGIFIGIALANVFSGIYAGYQIRKYEKDTESKLTEANIWKDYLNDFTWIFGKKNN